MGDEAKEFVVKVTKKEVVAAVLPMQEHWLPLSNLDLFLPPLDFGVFFCYNNNNTTTMSFGSMVRTLKKSLAQALVSYYAFSGEVEKNSMGEPELLCSNRGVDFVEAEADIELQNLNFYNPDQSVEGKLVPEKKHGVLAVQATSLNCGGLVVACTFDHRIADAYSANMFLVSWAQIAQAQAQDHPTKPTGITQPCYRRSLLSPRRPLSIPPSVEEMYISIADLPTPPSQPNSEPVISRIYYVTEEQLLRLQSLASSNTNTNNNNNNNRARKWTKLESFSAFLWKTVAAAAAAASASYSDSSSSVHGKKKRMIAKMGIVVDGRKRLSNGDKKKEEMMSRYLGNVLSIPFGGEAIDELMEKPLSWVAEKVHGFVETATTEEHFLGLIDWMESQRPVPAMTRVYCETQQGPSFVVSSGQRFPQSKVEFGWGKPLFGSYHFPWGGDSGYVMPMPSPNGNGDWIVYMHFLKHQLEFIQSHASNIFRPLSWDYLLNQHY